MAGNKIATVFGGTGFVGRQVVRDLAKRGYLVKVGTRVPERAYFLKPCGDVGQVTAIFCDYQDVSSVSAAVRGSDVVVNCIGILYERGKRAKFKALHSELPAVIGAACAKEGVSRFVHISALSVETGRSRYAKTKLAGEEAVRSNFPQVTILRPSVIFGKDDHFFNKFAELSRFVPFLLLIGGGKTKFQPVYVADVADAVMAALERTDAQGNIYELGGPEVVSFKEIYERMFVYTGRARAMISVPFWMIKIDAFFLGLLPNPLLTPDQVESLKSDNVVREGALGFADLGLSPTAMDLVLPTYLRSYREGGRFSGVQEA